MSSDLRKTEIFIDGKWIEAHFSQIRINDKIRLYESDGEPVLYKGSHELWALSEPYLYDLNWTVDIQPCEK
jgi:hypothetical protein